MATLTSKPSTSTETTSTWRGFKPGLWQRDVNVRWFLQQNYTPYDGDGAFLAGPPSAPKEFGKAWRSFFQERKKGVLDVSQIPSSITAHAPGYIDAKMKSSSAFRPRPR